MQSVSECSKMYAECMQIHEFACSYICLLAGPWACMQFLSMSEQLTRISQCFFLQDQWEKLLAVSICCCMIYVCYKELAIAGCKWFWCYLMQLLDEVGFPTPISNEVCDGIMRPGPEFWRLSLYISIFRMDSGPLKTSSLHIFRIYKLWTIYHNHKTYNTDEPCSRANDGLAL